MKKAALCLTVASVVLLAGCTQTVGGGGKPSDVARAYIEAIVALDINAAKGYVTDQLKPQFDLSPDQIQQLNAMKAMATMRVSKFNVLSEQINGDSATVNFEYAVTVTAQGQTQESPTQSSSATMVKVGSGWKIAGGTGSMFGPPSSGGTSQ